MDHIAPDREAKLVTEDGLEVCLNGPAIARLIEEVRSADFMVSRSYNRTYNRHNR